MSMNNFKGYKKQFQAVTDMEVLEAMGTLFSHLGVSEKEFMKFIRDFGKTNTLSKQLNIYNEVKNRVLEGVESATMKNITQKMAQYNRKKSDQLLTNLFSKVNVDNIKTLLDSPPPKPSPKPHDYDGLKIKDLEKLLDEKNITYSTSKTKQAKKEYLIKKIAKHDFEKSKEYEEYSQALKEYRNKRSDLEATLRVLDINPKDFFSSKSSREDVLGSISLNQFKKILNDKAVTFDLYSRIPESEREELKDSVYHVEEFSKELNSIKLTKDSSVQEHIDLMEDTKEMKSHIEFADKKFEDLHKTATIKHTQLTSPLDAFFSFSPLELYNKGGDFNEIPGYSEKELLEMGVPENLLNPDPEVLKLHLEALGKLKPLMDLEKSPSHKDLLEIRKVLRSIEKTEPSVISLQLDQIASMANEAYKTSLKDKRAMKANHDKLINEYKNMNEDTIYKEAVAAADLYLNSPLIATLPPSSTFSKLAAVPALLRYGTPSLSKSKIKQLVETNKRKFKDLPKESVIVPDTERPGMKKMISFVRLNDGAYLQDGNPPFVSKEAIKFTKNHMKFKRKEIKRMKKENSIRYVNPQNTRKTLTYDQLLSQTDNKMSSLLAFLEQSPSPEEQGKKALARGQLLLSKEQLVKAAAELYNSLPEDIESKGSDVLKHKLNYQRVQKTIPILEELQKFGLLNNEEQKLFEILEIKDSSPSLEKMAEMKNQFNRTTKEYDGPDATEGINPSDPQPEKEREKERGV